MSTSDRPSAGSGVPRQPTADDAAPAGLSLPREERLALARALLSQGSTATPVPDDRSADADPWGEDADEASEGGSSESSPDRRGVGRIRRIAADYDPWAEGDDVASADALGSREAPASARAPGADPTSASGSTSVAGRRGGRRTAETDDVRAAAEAFAADDALTSNSTRGRRPIELPVDPWADDDHSSVGITRDQAARPASSDRTAGGSTADQAVSTPEQESTGRFAAAADDSAEACERAGAVGRTRAEQGTDAAGRTPAVGSDSARPAGRDAGGRGEGGSRRAGAARRQVGGARRGRRRSAEEPDRPVDAELDGAADPQSVARQILLDKLTGQPRTRAELAAVLAEREIPDEVADEVLDRFTDVGLIDDAAFANAWVESRHRGRGLGKRALAQELRRRGVDDQLARDALDELDPEQEEETARELVRRKLRSMRSLDRQVAMRRLLGMLARKGYPGGLAMSVVKKELDAGHDELPLLDPSGLEPD